MEIFGRSLSYAASSSASTSPRISSRGCTVPHADPYLLPMAGAADRHRPDGDLPARPDDAFRQGLWIVIGVALFAATLLALRRDYRGSRATGTSSASARSCCSRCRALPGDRQDGQRRPALGPRRRRPVPARRAREDLPDRLPRRLPAREARGARAGPAQGLRAAARDLGRRDARARRRRTTSAARSSTSGSSSRCSTSRPARASFVAGGLGAVRRRRRGRVPGRRRTCSERVTIWLHPWTTNRLLRVDRHDGARQDCELPDRAVALLDRERRLRRHRARPAARSRRPTGDPIIPYLNTDFIYSALAQELGLDRRRGAAPRLHALHRARLPDRARSPRTASRSCSPPGSRSASRCRRSSSSAASLRVIPLTGITLPFVSYGGSSVVANFVLLAGLLLVSNRANAVGA